jgi:alpha-L-arabinofuranosidase
MVRVIALCATWLCLLGCASEEPILLYETDVVIETEEVLAEVNPYLYGINTARWDESIFPGPPEDMLLTADRDAIRKIREAGFTVLKYPGGTDADRYVWNSPDNNPAEMSTDEYAAFLEAIGGTGFITVNFNESPELAAEWVRYTNRERGYTIPFWEVGDEQWGWWARGHSEPGEYAARFKKFVRAMKAVDPAIQIAANVRPVEDPGGWTAQLLRAAGEYIDMVTFTFYPLTSEVNEDEDTLFASIERFRQEYSTIRNVLRNTLPPEKADTMWIIPVGYNSVNIHPGPITVSIANALWVADMLGTMSELGIQMACYWAIHNAYPPRGGDYGVLTSDGTNTPNYSYYPFKMFTRRYGRSVVETRNDDDRLSVYAARNGSDSLSIVFINKNSTGAVGARVTTNGFQPAPRAGQWILDASRRAEQVADLENVSEQFRITVPPYSVVMLRLVREGSTPDHAHETAGGATNKKSTKPN